MVTILKTVTFFILLIAPLTQYSAQQEQTRSTSKLFEHSVPSSAHSSCRQTSSSGPGPGEHKQDRLGIKPLSLRLQ